MIEQALGVRNRMMRDDGAFVAFMAVILSGIWD